MKPRLAATCTVTLALLASCGFGASSAVGSSSSPLASWETPAWFVDPANTTGAASDSNTCTTADAPCSTYAEIGRRWDSFSPEIGQDTTITFLSAQSDQSDPVYLAPALMNGARLSVQGVLGSAQQIATGTLASVTAKSPAASQLLQAALPAGAAPGQLIVNATHASRAWVYANAGGSSWLVSQPLAPVDLSQPLSSPVEVDWSNGDSVTLYKPVEVDVVQAAPTSAGNGAGILQLYQLTVFDPLGVDSYDPFTFTNGVRVLEATVERTSQAGTPTSAAPPAFANVNVEGDITADFGSTPSSGLQLLGGQVQNEQFGIYASLRGVTLDADIVLGEGSRADLFDGTYGKVFVDSTSTLFIVDGGFACTADTGAYGPPLLWGTGTVDVSGVARMQYPSGANRAQGTFVGVNLELDTAHSACAGPAPTSAAWPCGIALTAQNLDRSVASGGFGGVAVAPGGATLANLPLPPETPDAGMSDGGGLDASEGGNELEAGPMCVHPVVVAPAGPSVCGDGWRDPATEECDDGLGAAPSEGRSCTSTCSTQDQLVAGTMLPDGGVDAGVADAGVLPLASHTLGEGRHPIASSDTTLAVAYLDPDANPVGLSVATFSSKGVSTGVPIHLSGQPKATDASDPILAGLPCDRYAAVWGDLDGDGDGQGIAAALVDATAGTSTIPSHLNTTTAYAQFAPDSVWTGASLIVAWTDTSDASTGPDLRYRTFDANLSPTSPEQTLAATADIEGDVSLASLEGSWAAAWRVDATGDASGFETIRVHTGTTDWTVGPAFLPPSDAGKIALAELDADHLLVVYPVGIDPAETSVPNAASKLRAAVLDVAQPGSVTGIDVPISASVEGTGAAARSHGYASAARVGSTAYIAWWTEAAPGDPNGEQLWLQPLGWNGVGVNFDQAVVPLPRTALHQVGDQRRPSLVASALPPGGALVAAWDDLGRGLGSGEANEDVVLGLMPAPITRDGGGP
jgi:hypothetical protein